MFEITFYGGVEGEVGGNTILLRDKKLDASILLDFGINYHRWGRYFSFPLSRPANHRDLIRCGVTPDVKGLYAGDVESSPIDSCIVSHPHGDHYRYVSILREGTRVHLSSCGRKIIGAVEEVKESKSFEERIEERVRTGELDISDFRTGDKITVGRLEVEPVHVDHSIPGSYGFLIHTSCGMVVYTGDFRRHGSHPDLTDDFIRAMQCSGERVGVLMCEGTNLVGATSMKEEDVLTQAAGVVQRSDGLVIVDHSQADIDRIRTIHQVALQTGRELVVSEKIANTLLALSTDRVLGTPARKIIQESSVYFGSEQKWVSKKRKTRLEKKIEASFGHKQMFAEEIGRKPSHYILATSVYRFEDLKDLQPPPGSIYILSASEPFEEEREFDFERLLNWLDTYGMPLIQIHASGHAIPNDLREMVQAIRPEILTPIHTKYPNMLRLYVSDCCDKVIVPERGVSIQIP